eukprot:1818238-Pyramimonas_sp.AAC.1
MVAPVGTPEGFSEARGVTYSPSFCATVCSGTPMSCLGGPVDCLHARMSWAYWACGLAHSAA